MSLTLLEVLAEYVAVWSKLLYVHNNNFLLSLSRLVQNQFYAIGIVYGITTISASVGQIKSAV